MDLRVEADGQVMMCILSSSGTLHLGQFEWIRCFLLTIILPEVISSPMNLEINLSCPNLTFVLLSLNQSQLTNVVKPVEVISKSEETW